MTRPDKLGGLSGGETPLPIPNREVKPASADGTRSSSSRESRTPPITSAGVRLKSDPGFFCLRQPFLCRAQLLAPLGIERAQPAHPLAERRMRDEEPREAFVGERVCGVERFGRGARLERDELRRLFEPQ
jgi:hypothetical protein